MAAGRMQQGQGAWDVQACACMRARLPSQQQLAALRMIPAHAHLLLSPLPCTALG